MSKLICYTAIFGKIKDVLQRPKNIPDDVELHAYLDEAKHPEKVSGWKIYPAKYKNRDPRRQARHHKLLSHLLYPDAEYTLWVDGCLTPQTNPWDMVQEYLQQHDMATFRHMDRNCVYRELEACLVMKKDIAPIMRQQVDGYRAEGYPYNNGLAETTAVLRRHTTAIKEMNSLWWSELNVGSLRDQLSLDYVMWKLGISYAHLRGNRCKSPHFLWRNHR